MAKTKQEKKAHWLNKSQMAASLDISVQAFDKWGVKPVAKIGRESFYEARSVLDNRLDHADQKNNREPLEGIPGTLEYERVRLTREQADNVELKNEMARAKTLPIELLTAILNRIAPEISGKLDTLPLHIKRKHPELDNRVIESIRWHCVKAQNAMAKLDEVTDQVVEDYVSSLETD